MFRRSVCGLALVVLAGIAAGCGGGAGGASSSGTPAAVPPPAAPASTQPTTAPTAPTAPVTSIKLRASGLVFADIGSQVTLRYNGVSLGSVEVRSSQTTEYRFDAPGNVDGGDIDVVFSNATTAQGQPVRHLKLESLTVGDTTFLPMDGAFTFDSGDGVAAFDGADLDIGRGTVVANGALRLKLPSSPSTALASTTATKPGFYVDAVSGDDANPGSIERPWRSLGKLSGVRLTAGQGVYLRCGSLWRETLSLSGTQLVDGNVVAGYGPECSLRKAVITGADDFSGGWSRDGGVWSRSVPSGTPKITQLFIDDRPMRTVQWPDQATARRTALAGSGSLGTHVVLSIEDAAALAGKDLIGATAQLRTQAWFIETVRVTGRSGGGIDLASAPQWSIDAGEGVVLQDKLWMLDSPGEFFHDEAAQRLYLIAPTTGAASDLNASRIEGSVRDVALHITQRSDLVVRDLSLRATRSDGLRVGEAPQAQVTSVESIDNARHGMLLVQFEPAVAGSAGPSITGSLVAGNAHSGIDTNYAQRAVISRNRVFGTGTAPGHQGISFAGINAGGGARVEDNLIDGSAYLGIYFSTLGASVVARNTIGGYCKRLSDCAGIYTWAGRALIGQPQSATVENNRVFAAQANLEGASSGGREVVAGIYIDDFSSGVVVRGNVLAGMTLGVFLHNASNSTVEGNRIWLPTSAAIALTMDQRDADWMTNNVIRNNEIVPLVQAQSNTGSLPSYSVAQAFWFHHVLSGEAALATGRNAFGANTVWQLQGPLASHALVNGPSGQRVVDALDWKAINPAEPLPTRSLRFEPLLVTLGPELALGGSFDSGLGAWGGYKNPAGSGYALQAASNHSGCSGPCALLTAGHGGDLLGSASFVLRTGAQYVYRWTAVLPSTNEATVAAPYISRSAGPWDQMADASGYVSIGPRHAGAGETLSYQSFFTAKDAGPAQAFIQLETLRTPVAIDDVSIREMTGSTAAKASDWAALAVAPASAARAVGCAELGWPSGCSAIDLNGAAVALPLSMTAGTQRLLLRADSAFRR